MGKQAGHGRRRLVVISLVKSDYGQQRERGGGEERTAAVIQSPLLLPPPRRGRTAHPIFRLVTNDRRTDADAGAPSRSRRRSLSEVFQRRKMTCLLPR